MVLYLTLGTLLLTLLICKIIHGWIFGKKKMQDIPGPKGWPLVGNSLQMDPMKPHETFLNWSKTYGNMFKIKIFQDDAVVLNDIETIKEMLSSEECSARPYYYRLNEIILQDWIDISLQHSTPEWNERKKVLTRSLNAYGEGQVKIESITLESIDTMFSEIDEESEHYTRSIDMRPIVHKCTAGIITTLLYGRKLEESELIELLEMDRGIAKLCSHAGLIAIVDFLPWMRHLPIKDIQGPIEDMENFRKWIGQKHLEMVKHCSNDEVDGIYFSLMRHVNKITNKIMTPEELMGISMNAVSAGFLTSTASLYSLLLVLINNPELQSKMYEEIDHVVKGRRPLISDRQSMPYVRAVMEETFRFATILPLSLPHLTSVDTMINGRLIPKGTTLFSNTWNVHHDEKYFDDPWKFKPERFLTSEGKLMSSDHPIWKHILPFSAGRRICPGEGLARNRIFLILASLMQKYKFLPEDDKNIPSSDPRQYDSGLVVLPYTYKVKIAER